MADRDREKRRAERSTGGGGDRPRRRYRLKKRAEQQADTRSRITDALVELHRTVGPAHTTVTEVAERAGVQRMTVYNHFPTEVEMIRACSGHWLEGHPPPDVDAWRAIADPAARLDRALGELYLYYEACEDMLGNVFRDEPIVPALAEVMQEGWWPAVDAMHDALARGRRLAGSRRANVHAALRLVLDFGTWQSLTESGLGSAEAAALAAKMVEAADAR
jgi:AcrR family transcriptional regulator